MAPRLQTGRRQRPPALLRRELDGRLAKVQAAMREVGTDLVVFVCAGTPSQAGWVRYLTGAPLWGPRAFVVLRVDHPRRTLITRSPDDANWYRLATIGTDVESTLMQKANPVDRLITAVETAGPGVRVGLVRPDTLSPLEADALRGVPFLDLTDPMMRLREVKAPFEVRMMRETGRLLDRGLDRFAEVARPGSLVMEALGEVDGLLRAGGCWAGQARVAFGEQPAPTPAAPGRRFARDDIILVHLVYGGPHGYWGELSGVFSFGPLPEAAAAKLGAAERALRAAARAAVPGSGVRAVREAADRRYAAGGLTPAGRHAVYVHPIGTDDDETPPAGEDAWTLRDGMTVAIHPAPALAGELGYFLAGTFVVRNGGARSLVPRRAVHRQIAPS